MNIETIMCAPFYSDLASIYLGLYENDDKYEQYAIFVTNITKFDMWVFSSSGCENIEGTQIDSTMNFLLENGILELNREKALHYMPIITRFPIPNCYANENDIEQYLREFQFISKASTMTHIETWRFGRKSNIYVTIYRNKLVKATPFLITESVYNVTETWREAYERGLSNRRFPEISTNSIIENTFAQHDRVLGQSIIRQFPIISKISSLYYEKSRGSGRISFTQNKSGSPLILIQDIPFTVEHAKLLRKMLEMTRDKLSLLLCPDDEGYGFHVYGIGNPTSARYTFCVSGHLEWEIRNEKMLPILRYKNGSYFFPQVEEFRKFYVPNRIQAVPQKSRTKVRKLVNNLLTTLREAGHGALVIISDNAKNEVDRLHKLNKGIKIKNEDFTMSLYGKCDSTPSTSSKINDIVTKALSAIDGAIFLDHDGNCFGIGMILDGDAIKKGTPARGSRYNSAKTYIERRSSSGDEVYAIICSEDGYIDILPSLDLD